MLKYRNPFRFMVVFVVFSGLLTLVCVDTTWAQAAGEPQVFGPAPVEASSQPTFLESLLQMLPMLAVCYLIFYFMVVKPQDTKMKKQKQLVDTLKKGESVVTTGGIVGKIAGTEKEFVLVEIAPNVKIKMDPAHVAKRLGADSKAEAA